MPIVPYIPKSKRVILYRMVDFDDVEEILTSGISSSSGLCKPEHESEPRRKKAVFAYTLETLKKIVHYGEPSAIICFVTNIENWFVGDLHLECQPGYTKTVKPLKEVLELHLESQYHEMECWFPNGHIPREQILEVKKRRDF